MNDAEIIDFVSNGEGLPFLADLGLKTSEDTYPNVRVVAITQSFVAIERIREDAMLDNGKKGDMSYKELIGWGNIEFIRTKRLLPPKGGR